MKQQIQSIEVRIDQVNALLAQSLIALRVNGSQFSEEMQQLSTLISNLIEKSKREHRFQQGQNKIADEILALL